MKVTPLEMVAMQLVDELGTVSINELQRRLCIPRASVQGVVRMLVAKGLVIRPAVEVLSTRVGAPGWPL